MSREVDIISLIKDLPNSYLGKLAKAESAKIADNVSWDNVLNKPSTFPPSSHTHDYLSLSGGTVSGTVNATNLQVGGANVYTTSRKPTPADIGALASNGKASSASYADSAGSAGDSSRVGGRAFNWVWGSGETPTHIWGSSGSSTEMYVWSPDSMTVGKARSAVTSNGGGFFEGNGDAANSGSSNIQIKSWYGIGFAPSISGQGVPQNQNAVWINVRDGSMGLRGNLNAWGIVEASSYMTTPISVCNRIQGKSAANRFYVGDSSCRIDTSSAWLRLFTSAEGASDSGIRIDPNGGVSFLSYSVGKHALNSDGSKYGGSIEIEGTTYGMSPIDSPEFLIEDILFNKEVQSDGTTITLNNIFAKSVNGEYAVFVNNSKAEVTDKMYDNFKITGYTGIIDIRIIGKRFDHKDDYFAIMGGFSHGTEKEFINQ